VLAGSPSLATAFHPVTFLAMSNAPLAPATTLDEVHQTLFSEPLETVAEIQAFYSDKLNQVRGGDKTRRLQLGLERAVQSKSFYKACLMGHQGVGKSTELTRLINGETFKQQFGVIRFSVTTDLEPGNFNPLDVLLLMIAEVVQQTAKPASEGGTGQRPDDALLKEVWDWFSTEKTLREQAMQSAVGVDAGAGITAGSLWGKVLGLFASLKSELRFASTRKREVVEYRLDRLISLIEVANKLLKDCNQKLQNLRGAQWLFIGEDFDKAGIPSKSIEDLFITYANIFSELDTHLIFNLPIGLYNSSPGIRLAFPPERSLIIPDTPVFHQNHEPNEQGRNAIRSVLEARMSTDLFEPEQLERLIVASGGNLRDLFSLVNYAADTATLREGEARINQDDANSAIRNLRSEYERRLGQNPYDKDNITYDKKAELLLRIYDGDQEAKIPTPVLYALLSDRAVQEFNGERWFGVHPLVVDLLNAQGRIPFAPTGGVPGGSR
jgi:hypothetical protein